MSFKDKVVIVTGASAGIGAAIALQFASEQAKVVLIGRNEHRLKSISERCRKNGAQCLIIKADVSKDEDLEMIVEKTIEKFEKIDVLINNAAMFRVMKFMETNFLETFNDIIHMNLKCVVKLTWLAVPHLIKSKGNIVNISSAAGTKVKLPDTIAYSTSKAALDYFSVTLAMEMGSYGVRVNVVSPGPVRTDLLKTCGYELKSEDFASQTALKRISEPSEIADFVLFLASDRAKSMTASKYLCDNGF